MRDVVNKNVTEEQLMTTAERIFSRGWASMKLYFMIGLPTEEEEDVREIVRVGVRARETGKRVKKSLGAGPPKVTVSVSTHVPKPHTPFQWCAMDTEADVRKKQAWLQEEVRGTGVDLRMHDSQGSWLEGIFARGDRRLCNVLERAYKEGARFDSWEDQLDIDVWRRAFEAEGLDVAPYLGTLPVTGRLPWDHISVGLEDGFLAREYRKALKSRLSVPCGKVAGMFVHHTNVDDATTDARKLVCYDCGVACDLGAMRSERVVYLTKLGAKSPRPPREPAPPAAIGTSKKKRPPPFVQGEPRRYRFQYTKVGKSAFLSHLDVIRALPRAFRRLELPLFYSMGFHPKPDMIFGPALSLGVSSLCEIVDLKVTSDFDPAEVLEGLTRGAAEGLTFLAGARLSDRDAGVSRIVDAARYAVGIPESVLGPLGGQAWLGEQVARVREASELKLLRRIDGIGKWLDVRSFVRTLDLHSDAARGALAKAGIVGDMVPLMVDVEIRGSGAVKISEVLEVISPELPFRAVRCELGMRRGDGSLIASPMDLPAVLKGRPPAPEPVVQPNSGTFLECES